MNPYRCHYCGTRNKKRRLTRDHIVPQRLGGVSESWNLVYSCAVCNNAKADEWPTCECEFCEHSRGMHRTRYGITNRGRGVGWTINYKRNRGRVGRA